MQSFFCYKPVSGTRVKYYNQCDAIVACEMVGSGTMYVGDFITLTMEAAKRREWYRDKAVRFGEQFCRIYGGAVYDDRGTVTIIVPRSASMELARRLDICLPDIDYWGQYWQQGAAYMTYDGFELSNPRCKDTYTVVPGRKLISTKKNVPCLWVIEGEYNYEPAELDGDTLISDEHQWQVYPVTNNGRSILARGHIADDTLHVPDAYHPVWAGWFDIEDYLRDDMRALDGLWSLVTNNKPYRSGSANYVKVTDTIGIYWHNDRPEYHLYRRWDSEPEAHEILEFLEGVECP